MARAEEAGTNCGELLQQLAALATAPQAEIDPLVLLVRSFTR